MDCLRAGSLQATAKGPEVSKRSPLLTDILWTLASQTLVAGAVFVHYYIIRLNWGVEGLAGYSLIFRIRSALEWIVLLQLPLAITRELGARGKAADPGSIWGLVWTGFLMGAGLLVASCSLLLISKPMSALLLFGSAQMSPWVVPFCAMLFAYGMLLIANGILRGLFAFHAANLIRIICIALLPTICLLLGNSLDLHTAVVLIGLTSTLVSGGFLCCLFVKRMPRGLFSDGIVRMRLHEARGLLSFGLPRLLTLAMAAVLATMLPWQVSSQNDMHLLAAINSLLAMIAASSMLTAPIGFVLLPHFSRAFASGAKREAATQLGHILGFTTSLSLIGTLFSLGVTPSFIGKWLGPEFSVYNDLIFGVSFMLPGFLILDVLRSPLDAVSRIPWNLASYGAGAAATCIVFYVSQYCFHMALATACALGLASGYSLAGITSAILAIRFYGLELPGRSCLYQLGVWLFGVLALLSEYALGVGNNIKIASCLLFIGIFMYISFLVRFGWVDFLIKEYYIFIKRNDKIGLTE